MAERDPLETPRHTRMLPKRIRARILSEGEDMIGRPWWHRDRWLLRWFDLYLFVMKHYVLQRAIRRAIRNGIILDLARRVMHLEDIVVGQVLEEQKAEAEAERDEIVAVALGGMAESTTTQEERS